MTYKEEFITFMVRSGVLTFGDFTTKSGRKTPYFVNTGNYKTGAQAAKLGDYYAACIQENMPQGITCLFGPAYKGIPLAVSAAASLYRSYDRDRSMDSRTAVPAVTTSSTMATSSPSWGL